MRGHRRIHNFVLAFLALAALPSAEAYPQKSTASYTVTDLGGLPGLSFQQSQALAINDYGEIAGTSWTAGPNGGVQHAVVWAKDATGRYVITDLGFRGTATGINNLGDVVASGFLIRPATVNGGLVWYQDLNGDGINDLAIPLGVGAQAINNNIQIAAGPDIVQFDAAGAEMITALPSPFDLSYAINDAGDVAGYDENDQATVWQVDSRGNVLAAETLSSLPGNTSSTALCIDALGRAAGYSAVPVSPIGSRLRATAWLSGSAPTDLGAPAKSSSSANGINTVNGVLQVVGFVVNNGEYAFLWKNGVMKDLNSLISASGINLQVANAINSHGQIVGYARVNVGKNVDQQHAFVLTPK